MNLHINHGRPAKREIGYEIDGFRTSRTPNGCGLYNRKELLVWQALIKNTTRIEIMFVIAVDTLLVNMTLILSHANLLVMLMQRMRETDYHREHKAESQDKAGNPFVQFSIHGLTKIRK